MPRLDAIESVEISWNLPAGFWKGISVLGDILAIGVSTYGEEAGKTCSKEVTASSEFSRRV